jgi:hypothetical protein
MGDHNRLDWGRPDCSSQLCEHGVCEDPDCAGGECLECSSEAEEGE